MNRASYKLLGLVLLQALGSQAFAQKAPAARSRTVGDVLKMIEREDRGRGLKIRDKGSTALPEAQRMKRRAIEPRNLFSVKPPKSSDFYRGELTDEVELERITDQQISRLYKLSQQYRRSQNRGELWLRLAELYAEKARLIEFKTQREYDRKLQDFQTKKTSRKPVLNLKASDEFNRKAVQLYEWFLKDFPNDDKVDQALFFLGYNNVQLGKLKEGVGFYESLTQRFPKSPYVSESYFALGEYYFENESWAKALENYNKVATRKSARLYEFALYKSAWCLYRLGKPKDGLRNLENVIRLGRVQMQNAQLEGRKEVNRIRLAAEARKDLVPFYAETRECQKVEGYFLDVTGSQEDTDKMLEGLAYNYSASGNRECARHLFRNLIAKNPHSPKAFDFQYQIVQNYLSVEKTKAFQSEMFRWIKSYGPTSAWYSANSRDAELVKNSFELQESTLRNYVLQLHQTAQNTRNASAQKEAGEGYQIYFQAFNQAKQVSDMHFFYGELLFDMKKWNEAAENYLWVSEHDPKSQYHEKALTNALIAIDKTLPDEKLVREKFGNSLEPHPFDPPVTRFQVLVNRYLSQFPKGAQAVELKFKMGRLNYAYGNLDEALAIFRGITRDHPRTKSAEYSANLILDIYDLKKDYVGLAKAGEEILANPILASSSAGSEVRSVVERASFKSGQDLEVEKKYLESAQSFEAFARANSKSNLAVSAQYNAGVNYERAGDMTSALRMYGFVLSAPPSSDKRQEAKNEALKQKTRKLSAGLTQQVGSYKEAAQQFERYANENPSDKDVAAFHFNAAVIYDGLDMTEAASRNYERYYKLSRSADRKESYFYMAEMYRREGNRTAAAKNYEYYLSLSPSDAQKTLDATYQIGVLQELMGRKDKAPLWYNRVLSTYKSLENAGKKVKAGPAAEAKFKLVMRTWDELKAIRIPSNPASQQKAVQQKLGLLNRLNNDMADVIRFDHGPTIVGALAATGQAYDHMNQAISQTPLPSGLSAEEIKQYKAGIEQIVAPFRAKAIENFKAALTRSSQLEAYNEWTLIAQRGLDRYAPDQLAPRGERAMDVRMQDWMGI